MYDEPLLNDTEFPVAINKIVVTVTERGVFWDREHRTIDYIADCYSNAELTLSLHQLFDSSNFDLKNKRTPQELHEYAKSKGFSVYRATDVDETQELYRSTDLHFGSRLHAHLYFLSQTKRSFLTYVDGRCRGISVAYTFPIVEHTNIEESMDYNFEIYRKQVKYYYKYMNTFVTYVKEELL